VIARPEEMRPMVAVSSNDDGSDSRGLPPSSVTFTVEAELLPERTHGEFPV
jgi:hypothetical protein